MPFQPGNQLAVGHKKPKPYAEALRLEINAAAEKDNPHKALRLVARAHLRKAAAGDIAAITELANRLDGKVPQAVVGDDEHPPAFHAWLQWMQILAGDTKSISPLPNDINGLATIEGRAIDALPALGDAKAALDAPAGAELVPSAQEETPAP